MIMMVIILLFLDDMRSVMNPSTIFRKQNMRYMST